MIGHGIREEQWKIKENECLSTCQHFEATKTSDVADCNNMPDDDEVQVRGGLVVEAISQEHFVEGVLTSRKAHDASCSEDLLPALAFSRSVRASQSSARDCKALGSTVPGSSGAEHNNQNPTSCTNHRLHPAEARVRQASLARTRWLGVFTSKCSACARLAMYLNVASASWQLHPLNLPLDQSSRQ